MISIGKNAIKSIDSENKQYLRYGFPNQWEEAILMTDNPSLSIDADSLQKNDEPFV